MGDHPCVPSVAQRNDIPTGQVQDFGVNDLEGRNARLQECELDARCLGLQRICDGSHLTADVQVSSITVHLYQLAVHFDGCILFRP
jgi:hypothetical protein